ncbi:MAG: ribosomal protein [Clostridiales bacterium]|jgi:small subunit ribosomal protein S6|nr:ribosomal protein [Clostridiales bacterium]
MYDRIVMLIPAHVVHEPLVQREEVNIMNRYESLFVVKPTLTEEQLKAMVDKVKGVIEGGKGVVDNVDEWGKRRLAYEINHINEGYYFLVNFTSSPELPKELDRILRISDDVIRNLVIKLD